MFITDKFVFIHRPKTGGMFVTESLKRLYTPDAFTKAVHSLQKRTGFVVPLYRYKYLQAKKRHVYRRYTPVAHRNKPVLSGTRDPISHYLSHYKFGWWIQQPGRWFGDIEETKRNFPSFPDLSFAEFCRATNMFSPWIRNRGEEFPGIGVLSLEFVFTYAKEPDRLIAVGKDFDALADELWRQIRDISWLRTRSLNSDLHQFLLSAGLPPGNIDFILAAPPVNAAKGGAPVDANSGVRDDLAEKEALLIEMNERIEANHERAEAVAA